MDELIGRDADAAHATERRAGYAELIAVGAVVAGSVGAIVGAARCHRHGSHGRFEIDRPEPSKLTAPHGDKLAPAPE